MTGFPERYPELVQFFGGYFNQDWDVLLPEGYEHTTAGALKEGFERDTAAGLLELQRILRQFLRETATADDKRWKTYWMSLAHYTMCQGADRRIAVGWNRSTSNSSKR